MFIQEEPFHCFMRPMLRASSKAYRSQGINIEMVMPQNEFNSAQVFPSCCWTPEGLARFVSFLGPGDGEAKRGYLFWDDGASEDKAC
jgi:glucosylceramidase